MRDITFDRWFGVLLTTVAVTLLPMMSLIEITFTGEIDFDAVGKGSMEIPTWISYLITWPLCLYTWVIVIIPAIRYIIAGRIFSLNDHMIIVDGQIFERQNILEARYNTSDTFLLRSAEGERVFHPKLSSEGRDALKEFFKEDDRFIV